MWAHADLGWCLGPAACVLAALTQESPAFLSPEKIKISVRGGRGEQCALVAAQVLHSVATCCSVVSAARLTLASCNSWRPPGTNSVSAQVLKKEPVVAGPSVSDPKSLKLQLRQDPQVISLILTIPNRSHCVSCSFENIVARMMCAWEWNSP